MKKAPIDSTRAKLTLSEKLAYGVGDISNGLAVSSIGLFLLIYLTDAAGLKPEYAGLAIMIGRVWDAVTDPLMGWISDHTESRWGKRRPYLLFGALPYSASFFLLWFAPDFANQVYLFTYVTLVFMLFNTCLTVVFVPYTSLTAAITQDYNERTSLTGYRMTAVQIAFLIGALLPQWIVENSPSKEMGYMTAAGILAVIMFFTIIICFMGTVERDLDKKKTKSDQTPLDYASSIIGELQNNKTYRISVAILLFTNCAITFVAVNLKYYIEYALGIKEESVNIMALLFVTAILCVPLWVLLAKKFGKAFVYRPAMIMYAIIISSLSFFSPENILLVYAFAVGAGVFHAAALTLPWAIVPDVVEHDELLKGKRREGLFYGGTTFSYKMATALPIFFSGIVLSEFGYVANVEQTPQAILGIKLLFGLAPAIFFILGAYISFYYPLTEEKHKKILDELEKRRAGME